MKEILRDYLKLILTCERSTNRVGHIFNTKWCKTLACFVFIKNKMIGDKGSSLTTKVIRRWFKFKIPVQSQFLTDYFTINLLDATCRMIHDHNHICLITSIGQCDFSQVPLVAFVEQRKQLKYFNFWILLKTKKNMPLAFLVGLLSSFTSDETKKGSFWWK